MVGSVPGGEAGHPDEGGGDAGDDRVRGYVLGYDGSGADDRAVADRHSWDDRDSGAEPGLVADDDRSRDHVGAPVRVDAVVERCQRGAVADEGAVPDGDSSGVLEPAADVDEDVLADVQVLAELA